MAKKQRKFKQPNPRQLKFCHYYTGMHGNSYSGNATRSYMQAYNIDRKKEGAYDSAKTKGCQLLTKGYILKKINDLMANAGFDDASVDNELNFLIKQHDNPKVKLGAIKEYNALMSRVTKKLDLTSKGKGFSLTELSDQADKDEKK